MNWPRNSLSLLLTAIVAVFTLCLTACGDLVRAPTDEELAALNVTYVEAEELAVTVKEAPPADEIIFLIDVTASHSYLGQIGDEIVALTQRDETTAVCVLQIASDSRASSTARLCLKPVVQQQCTHPPVKESGFFNTKEQERYRQAGERIEAELAECNAGLEAKRVGRRERQDEAIVQFLRNLQRAGNTDIFGAFASIGEVTTCGQECERTVWVFSDLKDDPMREREGELTVGLNGASGTSIKVRLIVQPGEGYDDDRKATWLDRFAEWGVPESKVEWKTFAPGEFALDGGTTGVVSGSRAPVRRSTTRAASPTPSRSEPTTADPPRRKRGR